MLTFCLLFGCVGGFGAGVYATETENDSVVELSGSELEELTESNDADINGDIESKEMISGGSIELVEPGIGEDSLSESEQNDENTKLEEDSTLPSDEITSDVLEEAELFDRLFAIEDDVTTAEVNLTPQYGSNGKFLVPIEAPVRGSVPISTRKELEAIKDNPDGNYHLVADIDLSGAEWVPIDSFRNVFDGQGYVIRNLTIMGEGYKYCGLFGDSGSLTVKNLGFEGTNIDIVSSDDYSGDLHIGGICGGVSTGLIVNCYVEGRVSVTNSFSNVNIGGICGTCGTFVSRATIGIESCYNMGEVFASGDGGTFNVGGICGKSEASIDQCYNAGEVSSSGHDVYSGGVSGISSGAYITNCYNVGNVSADHGYGSTGGICGYNSGALMNNCDNKGNITGIVVGGICGASDSSISNCTNFGEVTAFFAAGGMIGYLSADQSFVSIKECVNAGEVSALSSTYESREAYAGGICGEIVKSIGGTIVTENCYNEGTVLASSVVEDACAGGIFACSFYGNDDFSFTIKSCYNAKIGKVSAVSDHEAYAGGICGYFDLGDSYFESQNILVVENCSNEGEVSSSASYFLRRACAGGISGAFDFVDLYSEGKPVFSISIINCSNNGKISSSLEAGGISGDLYPEKDNVSIVIEDCYNTGSIISSIAGGICGNFESCSGNSLVIRKCYNKGSLTGNVIGGNVIGGICGRVISDRGTSMMIENCYSTGSVKVQNVYGAILGGICGRVHYFSIEKDGLLTIKECYSVIDELSYDDEDGDNYDFEMDGCANVDTYDENTLITVNNCYCLDTVGHRLDTDGSIYAKQLSQEQMKNKVYFVGFDFDTVWTIDSAINNGYPHFGQGNPDDDDDPDDGTGTWEGITGVFRYPGLLIPSEISPADKRDSEAVYFYSDNYFFDDAKNYNPHLSTMSLCFELSSWPSYEADSQQLGWSANIATKNVRELLTGDDGIGFDQFEYNSYWNAPPTKDSIGAVAANKKIIDPSDGEEYTLIALAVRGGNYYSEWASNFTVGISGQHEGFSKAKDNVLSFLSGYIDSKEITGKIKLWLVGYSRGAATANLVAGALNKNHELLDVTLDQKDLFAYTFETPRGELTDQISGDHMNIHNIINLNDLVPLVAPGKWDFWRYGSSYILPSSATTYFFDSEKEKMLRAYQRLTGAGSVPYQVNEFTRNLSIKVNHYKILPGGDPFVEIIATDDAGHLQSKLLMDTLNILSDELIGSREKYVSDMQAPIESLMDFSNSFDEEQREWLQRVWSDIDFFEWAYILGPAFISDSSYTQNDKINMIGDRFIEIFIKHSQELGINISKSFIESTLRMLAEYINKYPRDFIKLIDATIISGSVPQAHYPEVCFAWLRSQDSLYTVGATYQIVSGTMRILRVNCPVDVTVYDSADKLVASIVNDIPQKMDNSILSMVNENGEKLIYLPADEAFDVRIEATDDGTMVYSINELSLIGGGIERVVNYSEIPLAEGDTFLGVVPSFTNDELISNVPDGSSAQYQLFDSSNDIISPNDDIQGLSVESNSYNVIVTAENNGGYVEGGGSFIKGNFARITAIPMSGSRFLGWYKGSVQVSADADYRFEVTEDVTLTAQFTPVERHDLQLEATTGGKVTSVEGSYSMGTEIAVVAEPDNGYQFKEWTATQGTFDSAVTSSAWFTMPASDTIITAHFESVGDSAIPISHSTISGVTPPVAGKAPVTTITETSQYTGTVTWDPSVATFAHDTVYTATITLTPKSAYTLTSIPANFFAVSGATTTNSANSGIITAVFPKTGAIFPSSTGNGSSGGGGGASKPAAITTSGAITTPEAITSPVENTNDLLTSDVSTTQINPFADIYRGAWFFDHVIYVYDNGLMSGTSTDPMLFSPNVSLTRAMAVTVLYKAAGAPDVSDLPNPYTDIPADAWYADAVKWAAANGIMSGVGDGKFAPNTPITREQAAVTFYQYALSAGKEPQEAREPNLDFTDGASISKWAVQGVAFCRMNDVISGKSGNRFEPRGKTSRAEFAAMIHGFMDSAIN